MRDLVIGFALIAVIALTILWSSMKRGRKQYSKIEVFYDNGERKIYENVIFYKSHPEYGHWFIVTEDFELFLELKGVKLIAVTSRR